MAPDTVAVRLLGRFEVVVDDNPVPTTAWSRRRASELVKLLSLAPRHRLTRDQVIDALWPDLDADRGAVNVRKAAFHARNTLGFKQSVVLADGTVALAPDGAVTTDVARFVLAAESALTAADALRCRAAADLYGGELLPDDRYAEWAMTERQRLRLLYLRLLAGGGQWGRLVEVDPANERAHREIMAGHLANGDRRAALRRFEIMADNLREELGVTPDDSSINLYESALALEARSTPTPAERARTLLTWGVVHWDRADLAEAERSAVEARALAIDAGLGRELAEANELLGLVAYAQGKWREVFAREFVETLKQSPEMTPFVFDAHMCMSEFALYEPHGIEEMSGFADEILNGADDGTRAQGLGHLLRGEVTLVAAADPEAAETDLAKAAALHHETGAATGEAIALERMAQLESNRDNTTEAHRLHRQALDLASHSAVDGHLIPFIYGGILDYGRASVAVVDEAEAATDEIDVCEPCSMGMWVGAAVIYARAGDVARAGSYLRKAERVSARWKGGPWHAAVAEARAAVRLSEDARAEAVALLEEAVTGFAASGHLRDEARCRTTVTMLTGER